MASFHAQLEVDNNLYPVNRVFFTASRKRDDRGKPASGTTWRLIVSIDAVEQGPFAAWMFDPKMEKDVKLIYYSAEGEDEGKKLKEWNFKGTYAFGLVEMFIGDASIQTSNFILTGKEVSNGNATLAHDTNL
ncbi:MAG: hypothetical protein H7Y12_07255 [Sphingobacteriaceae bacterium]|nr:hypothetical protein [Cytophagaceae bacterium]